MKITEKENLIIVRGSRRKGHKAKNGVLKTKYTQYIHETNFPASQ
jgi:hypothetical protein